MSPTAFVRRFKQLLGIFPQAFYIQKRLEQACLMLEFEHCTIEKVAEACGFYDRNYFSTVFRKQLKISPAKFQKEYRGVKCAGRGLFVSGAERSPRPTYS